MRTLTMLFAVALGACSSTSNDPPIPPPTVLAPEVRDQRSKQQTDETATQEFLEQEIQRRSTVDLHETGKPDRTATRVEYIDVPTYADRYAASTERHAIIFPWGTAIGAGIGAIIGNQSGNRSEGAWIGASVGFLNDLARWNY